MQGECALTIFLRVIEYGIHAMTAGKRYVTILIISLAVIFGGSPLWNRAKEGESARDSSARQHTPRFMPHLGTAHYLFELNGMDIGTGKISLYRSGNFFKIYYEARTNKKVDRLYKARYKGEGIMEIHPLKPVRAELFQRVKSKTKETTIYFEENGRIITTETKTEAGKEPENEVREARSDGSVLDPLSAVFLLQGIDWVLGKELVLEVYTGKARYETRFTCVGEVTLESSGKEKAAWIINQVSRNLDEKQEDRPEKSNPGLRIYVSAEGYPDVLRVETTRRIGHLTLTLDRFEPASGQASDGMH
jgi:hypothetical protein